MEINVEIKIGEVSFEKVISFEPPRIKNEKIEYARYKGKKYFLTFASDCKILSIFRGLDSIRPGVDPDTGDVEDTPFFHQGESLARKILEQMGEILPENITNESAYVVGDTVHYTVSDSVY